MIRAGMKKFSLKASFTDHLLQYPPRLVLVSFAVVILTGTLLLLLPQATLTKGSISFTDALFTATSATCVTGLIVVDTGTAFTSFGQIVILLLIQLGGLGIMTLSTFFVFLISGRISIIEREVLIDTLSQNPIADLTRLLKIVLSFTLVIEAIGWVLLTIRFAYFFPLPEALYQGLFHAISAFCNAGFSLFSNSFINFKDDPLINLTLGILIILGGLGFIVVLDIYKNPNFFSGRYFSKLGFHTRLVLISSGVLLAAGFIVIFALEYSNTLQGQPLQAKVLISLFQSITARTAGFNTVDIQTLTSSTLLVLIVLMFIGASPGSCGGGVKNTTFMVLMASTFSRFRMQDDVNILYRRIPATTISRVISVVFFSILIVFLFTFLLMITELPEISHTNTGGLFLEILFEVISAFGTVGLSTGITPTLSTTGKVLITVLMFIGRLGPLTVALAVRGKEIPAKYKYLQEDVLVG